jgi:hypothetical protein
VTEAQDTLEYANARSLVSIKNYYAEKLKLARENNDIEQRLKENEIEAFTKEKLEPALPESSRVRLDASIVKAQGELAVLKAQKSALTVTNQREETDAIREFSDHLKEQRDSLVQYFGAVNDAEGFQTALDAAAAGYRDFVQKLRTEAAGQPELLKLADQIELQGKFNAVESALNGISREAALSSGQFELLNQRIASMQENGTIGAVEASGAYADIRKKVIEVMKAEILRSENQLRLLFDGTKAVEDQSLKYKELALQIAQSKGNLEDLERKANDTAKEINQNIGQSIKGLFMGIIQPGAEIQDVINDFALNVVNSVADVAAQGLTDMIMKGMGGMAGGIGGFFSSLFGGAGEKGTELNPMITKEALLDPVNDTKDELPSLLEKGWDSLSTGVSDLGDTVLGGLSTTAGTITDGLSQGWDLLMGFLSPLFSGLVAAIFAAPQAAQATSAATEGFGAAAGAMLAAHNGGIAGHLTMSKNGMGGLAPWVKYHSGGLVGAAPDEVSALRKRGVEVLSEQDPRHRNNIGKTKDNGESEGRNIRVVPVLDPSTIHDAISSSQGEDVIVAVIKRRASTIRQLVK